METITVEASRGFSVSDMEVLIGGAVVIAAVAWMVLSKMKQLRGRTPSLTPASNED
jgi:hypothetical protein